MELGYESITLKNAGDVIDERRGFIRESQIRQITTLATVENRSQVLLISENVRQKLGLKVLGERSFQMANGDPKICQCTDLVEVHGKNGHTVMPAMVFAGVNNVLLVSAPHEGLFLIAKKKPTTVKRQNARTA